MSAALTERLVAVAQAARAAGHGEKGAIYEVACKELRISRATLLKKLKEVAVSTTRKRRVDSGTSALTREEALAISAAVIESARKNEKRLYSLGDAVEALRSSGMIRAESLNTQTGELTKLSLSAIGRALYAYRLHPDQLLAPAPAIEQASLHPNHVWQIDASLCVLYYLKPGKTVRENGLRVMPHHEFYKNKPKNLARIAADRVWSYEITDHCSGWIYVEYVMGAESGENLCSVLINAMQERGGADTLHGVPFALNMDPGSANTGAMTTNLCKSLSIKTIIHKAGNARQTGSVEKARDIIERKFESGLKFQPVADLDELNALAKKWRSHFNATAIHSRHGKSRTALWMQIRAAQLIKAPSVEVCRELAVSAPEQRKVTPKLRVSFQGREFDVSSVPGVMVGERLMVTRNPWRMDAAQVVLTGEDGREVFYIVPEVLKNEFGFAMEAAVIGESFKRHADTPAQKARQEIEQLVTGTSSVAEAEAARKAKALPFGGQLQPYKHIDDTDLPAFLPRRGTEHGLVAPTVELPPLSLYTVAKRLKGEIPNWNADHYSWLQAEYPEGVGEDDIGNVTERLRSAFTQRPKLGLVGGV